MSNAFAGLGPRFDGARFALVADGRTFTPATMASGGENAWSDGAVEIRLVEERADDGSWSVFLEADGVDHVEEVCLLDHRVDPAPAELYNHQWWSFWGLQESTVVFARYGDGGFFACYANPFGQADLGGDRLRLSYKPGMRVSGRFRSDPLILGRFASTGRLVKREMLPGRDVIGGVQTGYGEMVGTLPGALDAGEIAAVRKAVQARIPWEPARPWVSSWDWGHNLFRLRLDEPGTLDIYERMLDLDAELGVDVVLLAPNNGERRWDLDGPWQHIMWLGMGLEIEHGDWKPGVEPAPVRRLLDAAEERGLGVVAYSNPQILWDRNDAWKLEPDAEALGWPTGSSQDGYVWTCLADESARARTVEAYRSFVDAYGLPGMSLDFVFWAPCRDERHGHAPGFAGRYAQWDGLRHVLRALRDRPDSWVEMLIGSQQLAPWGLADMTHPHPALGDNQPQWIPAWPDLSLDRVNGNYQRRIAFWLRNFAFAPTYKIPGQIGHQANREHEWPVERGWDWEGARYNLLSSIGSAPTTSILCYLPCWDEAEWQGMRDRDLTFFRQWLDFAKDNAVVLTRMEDLFEEPRPGAVDGTIALDDDGAGFVFLANPNYDAHVVEVPHHDGMLLRELHPEPGRLWHHEVNVDPHEVAVLELVSALEVARPALVGASGSAEGDGTVLTATGVPGTTVRVRALGSAGFAGEWSLAFISDGVTPTLGPWTDQDGRPVEPLALSGTVRIKTTWAPGSALPRLLAQLAPPIAPEGDEVLQPWSDPSRLRWFPEILDPGAVTVRCWVDGEEAPAKQAYVGTFEHVKDLEIMKVDHNLIGHYFDLTERLEAVSDLERPWEIELEIQGLDSGHFRGLRVAHLPARSTNQFTAQPHAPTMERITP